MQASFGRLKHWLITWEHRLDFWPAFKGALAARNRLIVVRAKTRCRRGANARNPTVLVERINGITT